MTNINNDYEEQLRKLAGDFEFFAHVTSHDLRDPLRQARIYTDELLSETQDKTHSNKIIKINEQIDLVLKKIALLREYSYLYQNKKEYESINLEALLQEILEEKKWTYNSAKIKITELPIIQGNTTHIKKLFSALLDNAIKFKSDKQLEIEISAKEENNFWLFAIKDNGIGLDTLYRELVFILFQRLDSEKNDGSYGAGLAFARKIVENHGGKIWYESDGESGTTFYFTIPKN